MYKDLMSRRFAIAFLESNGFHLPEDAQGAHDWTTREACNGIVEAQCVLSTLYWTGVTKEKDVSKAIEWCRKAASTGSDDARCALASHMISGTGVEQDPKEGVRILTDLANAGHVPSMLSSALLTLDGVHIPYSHERVVQLLHAPANAGSRLAQCLLGAELIQDKDLESRKNGVSWIKRAAENRSATAHRYLSTFYRNGDHGFPLDSEKATIHEALARKYEEEEGADLDPG